MKSPNPSKEQLEVFLIKKYLEEKLHEDLKPDPFILKYRFKLMRITPKLFFQYLKEKGIPLNCTLCNNGALSVTIASILQTEVPPELMEAFKNRNLDIKSLHDTSYVSFCVDGSESDLWNLRASSYHTHCQNCGHREVFQTRPVLSWYESLSPEAE